MSCPHRHDGAAYVLGALSPADRVGFEAHLPGCAACDTTVRSLARFPGVLAHARVEDLLEEPPPPPGDILTTLVGRVRHDRRARRIRTALVAAAAIVLAATGAVTAVELAHQQSSMVTGPQTLTAQLAPAVAVDIWGTAEITGYPEGTRITVNCSYGVGGEPGGDGPSSGELPYRLMVTNRSGDTDIAGSWHADGGYSHEVTLFSRWDPAEIIGLEVQDLDGTPILTWQR